MPITARGVRRRAFVSTATIVANAAFLAGTRGLESALVDVRADAYGHGLVPVARALAAAGIAGFVVSHADDRERLVGHIGHSAIRVFDADDDGTPVDMLGPATYGLSTPQSSVKPAMRLVAEAVAVKTVAGGRGVSYGYTYHTSAQTTLVLAGLGYADGIPRIASNRAPVVIAGKRGTVTGRIAMDQFVVDIGESTVTVGGDVVLFGDGQLDEPTVLDWAEATGLRPEVIVSGLGPRIERVYSAS